MSLREALNVPVRVVVAQLNCHQAAVIGARDFLAEPIVDGKILPLDHLIGVGLRQFLHTRAQIRHDYIAWHSHRLQSIFDYIETLPPLTLNRDPNTVTGFHPRPVLVIVFPEYSIPFESLSLIKQWADKIASSTEADNTLTKPTLVIFAGTHALPERTSTNLAAYNSLGFGDFRFDGKGNSTSDGMSDIEYAYQAPLPSRSVLPMFYHDHSRVGTDRIRSKLKLKRVLSPFELTNTGQHRYDPEHLTKDIDKLRVPIQLTPADTSGCDGSTRRFQELTFLPLVCSEALQSLTSSDVSFDIAVIPAYHKRPDDFDNLAAHVSHLQRLVLFCNDGRYGGSRFSIPESRRGDGWWLGHPNYGKLPVGDALLIADVAPMDLAERTAVNNPAERVQIQRLASIVTYGLANDAYKVAWCLRELWKREGSDDTSNEPIDVSLRRLVLAECLEFRKPTELQERKLHRLMALQDISPRVWALHALDVIITNKGAGTPSVKRLEDLERDFCIRCIRVIRDTQSSNSLTEQQHKALTEALHLLVPLESH